jgi:hypothetical protein
MMKRRRQAEESQLSDPGYLSRMHVSRRLLKGRMS